MSLREDILRQLAVGPANFRDLAKKIPYNLGATNSRSYNDFRTALQSLRGEQLANYSVSRDGLWRLTARGALVSQGVAKTLPPPAAGKTTSTNPDLTKAVWVISTASNLDGLSYPARVLATDMINSDGHNVLISSKFGQISDLVFRFRNDGTSKHCTFRLSNTVGPVTHEYWVNVYRNKDGFYFGRNAWKTEAAAKNGGATALQPKRSEWIRAEKVVWKE